MKFGVKGDLQNIFSNPVINKHRQKIVIGLMGLGIVIALAINFHFWNETNDTVDICVAKTNWIRNEKITLNMIKPYPMQKKEYLKSIERTKQGLVRKYVLYEDAKKIVGYYSAYSLCQDDPIMYKKLTKSYIDNTSMILYSFPGKILTRLDVKQNDLTAFKQILEIGDKINIDCVYNQSLQTVVGSRDALASRTMDIDTIKTGELFVGVTIADILNTKGESILDYMTEYRNMTSLEQEKMDKDEEWQKNIRADKILVAFTPEEWDMYLKYVKTGVYDIEISVPQRDEE